MSEELEIEYEFCIERYKALVEQYKKAWKQANDDLVKERILVEKLWAKISELITDSKSL
jgi:hypothetical protein